MRLNSSPIKFFDAYSFGRWCSFIFTVCVFFSSGKWNTIIVLETKRMIYVVVCMCIAFGMTSNEFIFTELPSADAKLQLLVMMVAMSVLCCLFQWVSKKHSSIYGNTKFCIIILSACTANWFTISTTRASIRMPDIWNWVRSVYFRTSDACRFYPGICICQKLNWLPLRCSSLTSVYSVTREEYWISWRLVRIAYGQRKKNIELEGTNENVISEYEDESSDSLSMI